MKIEEWNGHEIRFVWHSGEWWAVAKDVAKALGYRMASDMTRNLDDEEKGTHIVRMGEISRKMTIISETGIYEAVLNSRRQEAKEFKRWVKQVIKEIRQQIGLEGVQVFRMMDKEHQKQAMGIIKETLGVQAKREHYIKANTVANKAVASKYGFPKMVKKEEMTPEMLRDRQPILEEAAQLTAIKEAFGLNFSVAEAIYKKYRH